MRSHARYPHGLLILVLLLRGFSAVASGPAPQNTNYSALESLIKQGKLEQAEQQLQQLLQRNPADGKAEMLLAEARLRQKKYADGEKLLRSAWRHSPSSLPICHALGRLLLEEARNEEATKQFEACLTLGSTNSLTVVSLAKLYMLQGQFEKSLALLKNIPAAGRPSSVYPTIAADNVALGRQEAAQEAIGEVLRRAPDNPDLVPDLANTFVEHGMASDAAELLRIAGPHQKNTSYFLSVLAKAQAATGSVAEAKATLAKALQQDPQSPQVLNAAAQIAITSRDWNAAAQYLDAALSSGPPRQDVLQGAVMVELRENDLQAAHNIALRWHEVQPENPASALALAVVLVEGSHYGEAKPLLQEVLQRTPGDKRALLAMGVVQYNEGQLAEAKRSLDRSLGKGPDDANAHYFLGLIAKQEGDLPGAISHMQQSLAIQPDNAKVLGVLGQLYLQQNNIAEARTVLEKAIEKAPENPQNHYELAQAYKKLSMTAEAQAQLLLYEKLRPQRPQAPQGEAGQQNPAKPN